MELSDYFRYLESEILILKLMALNKLVFQICKRNLAIHEYCYTMTCWYLYFIVFKKMIAE